MLDFNAHHWPSTYDFETDPVCQKYFRPFIEQTLNDLKDLDHTRLLKMPDTQYIFHEHTQRVAQRCHDTCLYLNTGETIANNLYWAALAHDLGKADLPPGIWETTGAKPSPELKAERRSHTSLGLKKIQEAFKAIPEAREHPFHQLLCDVVMYHHEEMNGTGTHGLHSQQIPMPARLVAIVEDFDGQSIPRPHFGDRDLSPQGVIDYIEPKQVHDPILFAAFKGMILEQEAKKKLEVSSAIADDGPDADTYDI